MSDDRFGRLSNWFEKLRVLPPGAREPLLEDLSVHDPEMHREIVELLEEHESADEASGLTVTESSSRTESSVENIDRESIGPYKVLALLGEGGMGSVYLAEQSEPVRRRVAIKVIKLGMDTRQVIARFEAERQALALMNHPAIARVLDAGSTADGRPYFVMEHVKGVPLTEYCDKQRLTIQERLELFTQVCHGVQHAHHKGIIHRDLKPANVLVHLQDGVPTPKIIDFGIAKATEQRLTERTVFTEIGQIIGTPEYMSPEQAEMSGLDVDTRTDVYSLGVMLYELLTGALPLDGKTLRKKSYADIQKAIREDEPQKPSTRLARTPDPTTGTQFAALRRTELPNLVRRLRGDLDWIGMKAIAKDPTHRYQTAAALAEDVRRHIENQPVLAGPPSARYRLGKLARRYKIQFVSGLLILTSLVLGIVAATWFALYANDKATEARTQRDAAQRATKAAEDATNLLTEKNARLEAQSYARRVRDIQESLRRGELRGLAKRVEDLDDEYSGFHDRWLHARTHPPKSVDRKFAAAVGNSVEMSGDGRRIAVHIVENIGIDELRHHAEIVDLGTDRRVELAGGRTPTFHPTETVVLTRHPEQNRLRLWTVAGEELSAIELDAWPSAACFSGDGKQIAAVTHQGTLTLIPYPKLEPVRILQVGAASKPIRGVETLEFHPDGFRILAAGNGRAVILDTREDSTDRVDIRFARDEIKVDPEASSVGGRGNQITSGCFSPDGQLVLLGGGDGRAGLWSARDGQLLREFARLRNSMNTDWTVHGAAFSGDGRWAFTAGHNLIRVHSVRTGEVFYSMPSSESLRCIDVHDSRSLLTGTATGTVGIHELAKLPLPLAMIDPQEQPVIEVCPSPDGKYVYTVSSGSVGKWNLATGTQVIGFNLPGMTAIDIHPNGHQFAVGQDNGRGLILDSETGALLRTFELPEKLVRPEDSRWVAPGIRTLRYSPDGTTLAVGAGSTNYPRDPERRAALVLFDTATGVQTELLDGFRSNASVVAFSPRGRRLAAGDFRGLVQIWDLAITPRRPVRIQLADDATLVLALTFSRDGEKVFVALNDGRLGEYEADSGDWLGYHPVTPGVLFHLEWIDDRRMFVLGAGRASVWDVESDSHLLDLPVDDPSVLRARLLPDRSGYVVAGTRGHIGCFEIAARPDDYEVRSLASRIATLPLLSPGWLTEFDAMTQAAADDVASRIDESIAFTPLYFAAWRYTDPVRARRETKAGLDLARRALSVAPKGTPMEGYAHQVLGLIQLRAGNSERAVEEFLKVKELWPSNPHSVLSRSAVHVYLAEARHRSGHPEKAREELSLAWQSMLSEPSLVEQLLRVEQLLGFERTHVRTERPFDASHAVGPPNAVLGYGNAPAWRPNRRNQDAMLDLYFEREMPVTEVRVFENITGGHVAKIEAIGEDGRKIELWSGRPHPMSFGMFAVRTPETVLQHLRITLRATKRRMIINDRFIDDRQIDAVQIVGPKGTAWAIRAVDAGG